MTKITKTIAQKLANAVDSAKNKLAAKASASGINLDKTGKLTNELYNLSVYNKALVDSPKSFVASSKLSEAPSIPGALAKNITLNDKNTAYALDTMAEEARFSWDGKTIKAFDEEAYKAIMVKPAIAESPSLRPDACGPKTPTPREISEPLPPMPPMPEPPSLKPDVHGLTPTPPEPPTPMPNLDGMA